MGTDKHIPANWKYAVSMELLTDSFWVWFHVPSALPTLRLFGGKKFAESSIFSDKGMQHGGQVQLLALFKVKFCNFMPSVSTNYTLFCVENRPDRTRIQKVNTV